MFREKKPEKNLPHKKIRGIPKDHGPGLFNPHRSVRFQDKKKNANKKQARGRSFRYDEE